MEGGGRPWQAKKALRFLEEGHQGKYSPVSSSTLRTSSSDEDVVVMDNGRDFCDWDRDSGKGVRWAHFPVILDADALHQDVGKAALLQVRTHAQRTVCGTKRRS